jgi:hypothetical protein
LIDKKKRLREIEDRKIEILKEIPHLDDNNGKIVQLNNEYVQLDDEYYHIKIDMIKTR